MRPIKFRIFDLENRRFLTSGSPAPAEVVDLGAWQEEKRWAISQYTGLKDAKGREIWEGDIIEDCAVYCEPVVQRIRGLVYIGLGEFGDMSVLAKGYGAHHWETPPPVRARPIERVAASPDGVTMDWCVIGNRWQDPTIPHKTKVSLVENNVDPRNLKATKTAWGRELKLVGQLIELYPNEAFWAQFNLGWFMPSFAYLKTPAGKIVLENEWRMYQMMEHQRAKNQADSRENQLDGGAIPRESSAFELDSAPKSVIVPPNTEGCASTGAAIQGELTYGQESS